MKGRSDILSEINKIVEEIIEFRDERGCSKFHNSKDLAISLQLEASELLELFQWKSSEEVIKNNHEQLEEELADVFIYAITMAHDLELDIQEVINRKLVKNSKKYPIDKSYGTNKKYTEFEDQ